MNITTETKEYTIFEAKHWQFRISSEMLEKLKDGNDCRKKIFYTIYQKIKPIIAMPEAFPADHTRLMDACEIYHEIMQESPKFEVQGDLLQYCPDHDITVEVKV